MKKISVSIMILSAVAFLGCSSDKKFIAILPEIKSFDPVRYMGTWYEIARFQHSFEKDLIKVSAEYKLNPDGTIQVLNSGYPVSDPSKRKEARGKAKPGGDGKKGYFRVSFFGPFYGDYRIIALDEKDYQYSLVVSGTRDYLWILSRTKKMDPAVYDNLLKIARDAGLDTDRLVMVPQE